jgi:hypothetical protein
LWKVQNLYYGMTLTLYPQMLERKDRRSAEWVRRFTELGRKLGIALKSLPAPQPHFAAA